MSIFPFLKMGSKKPLGSVRLTPVCEVLDCSAWCDIWNLVLKEWSIRTSESISLLNLLNNGQIESLLCPAAHISYSRNFPPYFPSKTTIKSAPTYPKGIIRILYWYLASAIALSALRKRIFQICARFVSCVLPVELWDIPFMDSFLPVLQIPDENQLILHLAFRISLRQ